MKNNKTQPAQASDGYDDKFNDANLPSQTGTFHGNNNPAALPNVKETRKTGVKLEGTAYLRSKENGTA